LASGGRPCQREGIEPRGEALDRLGFVVSLARSLADRAENKQRGRALANLEVQLDRSRLAREDTFCRTSVPEPERRWLVEHRCEAAKHWNLLTDWTADALRFPHELPNPWRAFLAEMMSLSWRRPFPSELRPIIIGDPERHGRTLEMWIEAYWGS
jgi:hypothetical protein